MLKFKIKTIFHTALITSISAIREYEQGERYVAVEPDDIDRM